MISKTLNLVVEVQDKIYNSQTTKGIFNNQTLVQSE